MKYTLRFLQHQKLTPRIRLHQFQVFTKSIYNYQLLIRKLYHWIVFAAASHNCSSSLKLLNESRVFRSVRYNEQQHTTIHDEIRGWRASIGVLHCCRFFFWKLESFGMFGVDWKHKKITCRRVQYVNVNRSGDGVRRAASVIAVVAFIGIL